MLPLSMSTHPQNLKFTGALAAASPKIMKRSPYPLFYLLEGAMVSELEIKPVWDHLLRKPPLRVRLREVVIICLRLTEEILHYLGSPKHCTYWVIGYSRWCKSSSIRSDI